MKAEEITGVLVNMSDVESVSMATWSETKKNEFCDLFEKRANDARVILNRTAEYVIDGAARRYFIPQTDIYRNKLTAKRLYVADHERSSDELSRIASQRARAILKELPAARDAIQVIDRNTARLMDKKERLLKELEVLYEDFAQLPSVISLSSVPQDWTIAQFRTHIEEESAKKNALVKRIEKLGEEVNLLERTISKALYSGLPGLKEAVEAVVEAHFEQSVHLGGVIRRVTEKVKFGDSADALALLASFEKNEIEVSAGVKAQFASAIEKLNLKKAAASKALPVNKVAVKKKASQVKKDSAV